MTPSASGFIFGAVAIGSLMCACSGKAVRSVDESGGAGAGGAAGSAGTAAVGAGSPNSGGQAGGPELVSCGRDPFPGASYELAAPETLRARIGRFLTDRDDTQYQGPEPSAADAAGEFAMLLLDQLEAQGTVAPGLTRFFENWLPGLEDPALWAGLATRSTFTLGDLLLFSAPSPGGPALGITTDPGMLRTRTSIDARGAWMSRALFCLDIPAPPPTEPPPPSSGGGITRRDQHQMEVGDRACAACHRILDPLGWSLEHFDEMGAYRTLDNGLPIDSSGVHITEQGVELVFSSIDDLAPQLASSCEVARCLSRTLFEHALRSAGLVVPPDADAVVPDAELERALRHFSGSRFAFRSLIRAIVESPSFLRP